MNVHSGVCVRFHNRKPFTFDFSTGAARIGPTVAEEEEGLSLTATAFVVGAGGVIVA